MWNTIWQVVWPLALLPYMSFEFSNFDFSQMANQSPSCTSDCASDMVLRCFLFTEPRIAIQPRSVRRPSSKSPILLGRRYTATDWIFSWFMGQWAQVSINTPINLPDAASNVWNINLRNGDLRNKRTPILVVGCLNLFWLGNALTFVNLRLVICPYWKLLFMKLIVFEVKNNFMKKFRKILNHCLYKIVIK